MPVSDTFELLPQGNSSSMDRTRLCFVQVVVRLWSAAMTSKGKSETGVGNPGYG
jgi:hypothetical protein